MAKKINLRNIYFNVYDIGGPVGGIVPKGYGQPNFNLTSKINPSKVGIPSGGGGAGSGFLSNLGSNITSFLGSGLGINMLSNAAFGLLNPNGNSTGVGNAMQTIGGLASNIPGVGGIAGAAVGAVGGLVNTMFGSNINEENVALFRNLNKQLMNYTSNASTNEELLADFGSLTHLANVKRSDVGSDGWFSNKAKNLTKDINAERLRANLSAITSLGNTALTVDTTNDLLKGYKLAAYGGPLNMRYTGTMSPFGNLFKDGGIYIKPENRGKFTALKERTGKSATWFKEHGTPAQKKMATFALNAAKWKHDDGGPLSSLVKDINERSNADFVQRLLDPNRDYILDWESDNIATHKLGWATDDKGAIVFPNVQRINGKLYDFTDPKNKRGEWDALDSAIQRGDTLRMSPSQAKEFTENYKKYYPKGATFKAFGGDLLTNGTVFSNGVTTIGNGDTHENNPYEGVQMGVDSLGIPNLVEEDEVIWNDYVFSNRLKVPKSVREKYKLRGNKDLSFADAAKKIQKESEERPNDPISLNGLDAALSRLAMEQELIRMKKELRLNRYAEGGELGNLYKGTGSKSNFLLFKKKSYPNLFTTPNFSKYTIKDPFKVPEPSATTPDFSVSLLKPNASSLEGYISDMFEPINFTTNTNSSIVTRLDLNKKFKESPLRYAPILGHAAGVTNDLFSKPDYLAADELRGIELNPSLVGFTTIANKLRYKPLDTLRLLNPLNALASALRRNVMNISGGNRAIAMAGLLNVDLNLGNQVGQALMSADEYNLASEERREAFNRTTALYNAEMGLKAAMANAESRNAMARARYERDKVAALLSQLARDAYNTRLSNNLNILLEDLGNLGRERNNRNWLDILADKDVIKMNTKGLHVSSKKKNGGKLNRKKKGGFTYA